MPLPLILGIAAAIAAAAGVGSGIRGGVKMKDAKETMEIASSIQNKALEKFETRKNITTKKMDAVGKRELKILKGFGHFSDLIAKIQHRPEFKAYSKEGISLPKYDPEQLKEVSVGAGLLVAGLGGAAAGTAGGFAAAGATTAAVMAIGSASTGTAIASLSGAAATNATLAALGGGAIAAGGGGIALGTTILGATTLGVGLLVGGIIFNITGSKLSDKADEAYSQALKTEKEVNEICDYLSKLDNAARGFLKSLICVETAYNERLKALEHIIIDERKVEWREFSPEEKLLTQNLVLLVAMLYKMCQVKLVLKNDKKDGQNKINTKGIKDVQMEADLLLDDIG